MNEFGKLEVTPSLLSLIAPFSTDRQQAVKMGETLSDWKTPNEGVPQENKLGVIVFTVMTNKLLSDWHLRIKFVDDTSAIEIIPRNSISILDYAVLDIYSFAIAHNMKLILQNVKKC